MAIEETLEELDSGVWAKEDCRMPTNIQNDNGLGPSLLYIETSVSLL